MGKLWVHRLGPLLLLAGFSSTASAQIYLGAAVGKTDYRDAEYFGFGDESTAYEMGIGFRLQDVLAFEASYLNLGDVRDFYLNADVNISGITLSGKAIVPVAPELDLYAKVGIYSWEMNEIYRARSYYLDEGEDLIYGGGATFHLHQFDVNLEYRVLNLYDFEAGLTTVGISFVF